MGIPVGISMVTSGKRVVVTGGGSVVVVMGRNCDNFGPKGSAQLV